MKGDKELYEYIANITPSLLCQRTEEIVNAVEGELYGNKY